MNRRAFIKGVSGAVASVAAGVGLSKQDSERPLREGMARLHPETRPETYDYILIGCESGVYIAGPDGSNPQKIMGI